MEQKDLSVLSVKELRQMLKAITFNKNEDGDALRGNKGVEEKSEAQVETKRVEELRTGNDLSEIISGNVDVEIDEKEPNEQETERAEDCEAEQQLKLQPFSAEEKFEEVVGDNGSEKMNTENFSDGEAKPNDSKDIPYTNVAARKSNKEKKKRRTFERAQARFWRYDKRQRDRWKVWFNLSTSKTLHLRDVAESMLNVDERNQISEKDKGFRFNKTQCFTIGPEYFLAQSYYYPQLTHMIESTRSIVSAIVTSEIPKKSLLRATNGKSMTFLPPFGVDASRRKELSISSGTSKLLGEFFLWRDTDIATQGEVGVVFYPNGQFQSSNSEKNQQTRHRRLLCVVDDKEEDFGHDEAIGTAKTKKNGTVVVTFLLGLTFSHLFDTNLARGGTSTHLIPEFMGSGLIGVLCWDVLSRERIFSFLYVVDAARDGGYNFALCLNREQVKTICPPSYSFHISVLKKSVQSGLVTPSFPPALSEKLELRVQPEAMCKLRKLVNGQTEVLVKWKDMLEYENSWEDDDTLATQFPSFHLEDKVRLLGEGNERTPFLGKTYTRQPRTTHTKGRDTF